MFFFSFTASSAQLRLKLNFSHSLPVDESEINNKIHYVQYARIVLGVWNWSHAKAARIVVFISMSMDRFWLPCSLFHFFFLFELKHRVDGIKLKNNKKKATATTKQTTHIQTPNYVMSCAVADSIIFSVSVMHLSSFNS